MAVNPSAFGPKPQFVIENGLPAVGYQIFAYASGSSTKQDTFTDSTGSTANTNPIELNSFGEPTTEIWFTEGLAYTIVLAPPNDTDPPSSPLWTVSGLRGINDSSITVDQWVDLGVTPTYVSPTEFTLVGDQTSDFHVNRRVKFIETAGTVYGYISESAYTTLTELTVVLDSGTLDSGLSSVQLGLITADNTSLPQITNFVKSDMIQNDAITARMLDDSTLDNASIINGHITVTPSSNNYVLALKTRAGTDPSATDPVLVTFRSSTLSDASIVTRAVTSALSLTILSGATLGTTSAIANTLQALLIDNAGTVEIASVNNSGALQLNEFGVISTTAMTTGSDSADVIYSTAARTNVAYRNLEYIFNTQATAGTWVSAPTQIQPYTRPPVVKGGTWTYLPKQVPTVATSINFTGFPAWAEEIEIDVYSISTNGTIDYGFTGNGEVINYTSNAALLGAAAIDIQGYTGLFGAVRSPAAADTYSFKAKFSLGDRATNTWNYVLSGQRDSGTNMLQASGYMVFAATLASLSLTTVGGISNFDAVGLTTARYR